MGLQFENLVLNNRHKVKEILGIKPEEVIYDNPFFQHKTSRQLGCQIDYLIQTRFGNLYVIEIKFSKHLIKTDIISEMKHKIENLKIPRHISCRPVLIHVNGISDDVMESAYFANIIDFGQLLEK